MVANSVLAKMAVQISANNARFNAAMQQSRAQSMAFQKSLQGLNNTLRSFGVGFGAFEAARALQFTVNVMGDFEKEMSTVRAITNATGDQFKALEADAIRLGGATKFTASEVAQLQVAYGRLGFNTQEILDATEATLSLAAATGEDLARSADVAGSTVRGFGLDAKETMRVVDVMASSFNKSALNLEYFTESMKYVAPIAKAAGATVEETTALLATLADSGIRGSQAGTSLRRIFADLTKDGRPLQVRLDELGKKGLTLADSFDEVGRIAQTALLVLSENTDKTKNLTKEFDNATGSAQRMADIIQDNLWGDVTQLTSAIEGLILQFKEGTGTMRDFVQQLTEMVRWLSKDEVVQFLKGTAEQALFLNWLKLAKAMSETNDEGERMQEWLKQMNEDAILAAFGDPSKIFASEDWNPFGSMFDQKKVDERIDAMKRYREAYKTLLDTVKFQRPGRPTDTGVEADVNAAFYHRPINMDPASSMNLDTDNPVDGIVKEIEYNAELAASLSNLNEMRQAQIDKMEATAEMAVTMGTAIGNSFEAMLSGEQNFAQGLANITQEIISLYLKQSIAAMIAKSIKTGGPLPFASIALAAAGIGAVKALFSQIGGAAGGVGGGISGPPGRTPSEMKLEVGGRIRGYDIALNQRKESYRRSRLG